MNEFDFIEVNEYIDELVNQGLTWEQIGALCNEKYDKDYTESKWRKPYSVWRKTVDSVIYADSDKIVESELKRIARAKTRLDINKQIISEQRSLLNEEIRGAGLVELLNREIISSLQRDITVSQLPLPKGDINTNYVFVRSDGHYNGNQDLDLEFSEIYSIIADKQKEHGFNEIVFAELGDTIEGSGLRTSQLMAIKKGMVEQASDIARYYIELLHRLSNDLKMHIKFIIVESSNHTQLRSLGTGRSELPMEDLMILISDLIKIGVSNNPNIEMISAPIIRTEINGMSYIFEHGHDAGSTDRYFEKVESYYGEQFQYAYMGHFHNYESKDIYEIDNKMTNKNLTIVPHSSTEGSDFEKTRRLSSVPAIHFSIDTGEGKRHQENIVLRQSYSKSLDKLKSEKSKEIKIKKL